MKALCLAVLLLASAAAGSAPRRHVLRAQDGAEVGYRVVGSGEPTVIFSPCWGCDGSEWDDALAQMGPHGRFVLVDLPGPGTTGGSRTDWSVARFASDLAAVADELHVQHAVLVGHSMSGRIVTEAALGPLAGRATGVLMIDTAPDPDAFPDAAGRAQLLSAMRADFDGTLRGMLGQMASPAMDEGHREALLAQIARVPKETSLSILEASLAYPMREKLAALKIPLRSIDATLSKPSSAHQRAVNPRWQEQVMEGGHWLMTEQPKLFAAQLAQALAAISGEAARVKR